VGDAVLQPCEAGPELAVEAPDGLQHADPAGLAELARALGVGGPEQADEAGLVLGAIPLARAVLADERREVLASEVAGGVRELAAPHEGGVDDVLGDLGNGLGALGGPEVDLSGGDATQLGDDAAAGVGPGVEGFFEE